MKKYGLIIFGFTFFVIIQTQYFWETWFGVFMVPVFIAMILYWLALVMLCGRGIIKSINEKFKNRMRLLSNGIVTIIIILSFIYPGGMIDFERLTGKDVFIATGEGAANCTKTFRFKSNGRFTQTNICFGVSRNNGKYMLKNDTILLSYNHVITEDDKYDFGIIDLKKDQNMGTLWLYHNHVDTNPYPLMIIQYNL